MSALVTDQFRILNATNFIESVDNESNSYYVWVGLVNPGKYTGFARNENWDGSDTANPAQSIVPNPIDNLSYSHQYEDTLLFGKKITSSNIRRVIKRVDWIRGKKYDMYRHDYSVENKSPIAQRSRLYDSEYYVMNSDYKVYICIENGSNGINTTGNQSLYEPNSTDLEPFTAELGDDGYVWKYLFTVSPGDIVKFDSTEYITLPNNWSSSTDSQIVSVRENGDSTVNNNQIKTVYIDNPGKNYQGGENQGKEVDILGDGIGGKVFISVNSNGQIIDANVTSGGSGYTYGIVDLGPLQPSGNIPYPAKLIPIIPPSRGHGYDLYKELGADKVMIYTRFDDSSRDYPINTKFCQIGILKNPSNFNSVGIFTDSQFSGLYAMSFRTVNEYLPTVGEKISQSSTGAVGYVASYDTDTKVLKYFRDRSLYYGSTHDQTDYVSSSTKKNATINFSNSGGNVVGNVVGEESGFNGTISSISGITTVVNNSIINLGVSFQNGLANPEINKKTGDLIYIDNRPLVSRNVRQKEDIKIILEF